MSTITLSSSLVKKLTSVLAELSSAVDSAATATVAAVPAPKAVKAVVKKVAAAPVAAESDSSRAPRGSVKEAVIAELKAAGKTGVSVTDLAVKLNTKSQNLYTWFNQTGKKIPQIKKSGRGTYRYVGR